MVMASSSLAVSLRALKKILATYLTVGNCTICTNSKPSEQLASLLPSIKALKFILSPALLKYLNLWSWGFGVFFFPATATSSMFFSTCISVSTPSFISSEDSRFTSYFTYQSHHLTTLFLMHFSYPTFHAVSYFSLHVDLIITFI